MVMSARDEITGIIFHSFATARPETSPRCWKRPDAPERRGDEREKQLLEKAYASNRTTREMAES